MQNFLMSKVWLLARTPNADISSGIAQQIEDQQELPMSRRTLLTSYRERAGQGRLRVDFVGGLARQ